MPFFKEALGKMAKKNAKSLCFFLNLEIYGNGAREVKLVNFQEWSDSIYDA